ncbi:MAG: zeta toxin family protein [Oscillospiraceae bacterium]|nr:zeta toxin family protein [Oscillospiraceae bacterium]
MLENKIKLPEVIVFAGPNGSGKSTITKMAKTVGKYINADDIKSAIHCTDLEAAQKAERLRNLAIDEHEDFTFETVLSTDRNLELLRRAKNAGYFIRGIYVLTADPEINVARVNARVALGGHDVPEEKIISRYERALNLIPQLVEVCDILHIYDNTKLPFRIFKKRKTVYYHWSNKYWDKQAVSKLTGIPLESFEEINN